MNNSLRMILRIVLPLFMMLVISCRETEVTLPGSSHDLVFTDLAQSWDEAVPLGNGMLGALVWKKNGRLRLSLDRADLWDLRPMENLATPEWKYRWVQEQWKNGTYKAVQKAFDRPYDSLPAPSKIPAGAIEFDISSLGETESVRLSLSNAVCEVKWKNGARLITFVGAENQSGWYRFENLPGELKPELIPPPYNRSGDRQASEMSFFDLDRLGYNQGVFLKGSTSAGYYQEGWGGFNYSIFTEWEKGEGSLEGCWSIGSGYPAWPETENAESSVKKADKRGFDRDFRDHEKWWKGFWAASSVSLPDKVLEKQWYLEMYKFGSAARADSPPVSLQAVWTADNGKLPPWKGDFHHDLNTQLSYWPSYSSNHIDLEEGFINWLFSKRDTFRKYTRTYFEKPGLNVPGVTTLEGEPMGGWIQYSFGPTVSAWLSHHFYLHWRYTMDRKFLKEKAYPWISEVALFLDQISVRDDDGKRKLPLSSSPEIFDNSAQAWFSEISNFDLALIRWTFLRAAELALELDLKEDAEKWTGILSEWPGFAIDDSKGFMFTPSIPYDQSHRHFSHLMAFHPLGLIDYSQGPESVSVIENTLDNLVETGPDWWCGYSYSWLGNLYARARNGEGAAEALRIFSQCFCLPNSFHVNGDQTRSGKSKFTYRPFTLEGNFAFASGIQEMLIQSHTGIVEIFPAIPLSWNEISFEKLRTEGAFLVSAEMKAGAVKRLVVESVAGGRIKIRNPFAGSLKTGSSYHLENGIIIIDLKKGEKSVITAG